MWKFIYPALSNFQYLFKKFVPVNDQFKKAYFEPDRWSLGKDLSLTETQESHLLR